MEIATSFVYDALPGRVVFGAHRLQSVRAELARLNCEPRVFVISDPGAAQPAKEVQALLGERFVGQWTDVRQHVPVQIVAAAACSVAQTRANLLLAIGGGSATGLAKAIALQREIDIACIPTTYAGSEMTAIWGTSEHGHKRTGRDVRVLPKLVIYDPILTYHLPPEVTGPSGLNALAHCVEATYTKASNPLVRAIALEGIRFLAKGLPIAFDEPRNLDGRVSCLLGAYLAGASLAAAGVALHHKTCHVLGGDYDLDHGKTNAVLLPFVVRFNAPALLDKGESIAQALGATNPAAGILALCRRLHCPSSLREIGLPEEAVGAAARRVLDECTDNPRALEEQSVRGMLAAAFRGELPSEL